MGDLQEAQNFYGGILGIATSENNGLMTLHLVGGRDTLVYPRHAWMPPAGALRWLAWSSRM